MSCIQEIPKKELWKQFIHPLVPDLLRVSSRKGWNPSKHPFIQGHRHLTQIIWWGNHRVTFSKYQYQMEKESWTVQTYVLPCNLNP